MAGSPAKVIAPVAAVEPVERLVDAPLVALGAPTPAACAAAFQRGADLAGLMAQLRLALVEAKHALAQVIAATPRGDPGLQSFMRRLCLFLGETYIFDPS